jgi:hypothetical protein
MKKTSLLIKFFFVASIIFFTNVNAQAPDVAFATHFSGSANQFLSDIKIDQFGNTYCIGRYEWLGTGTPTIMGGAALPPSANSYDVFIAKLAPNGNCIWAKTFGSNFDDWGQAIEISDDGNIFILGNFSDSITIGNFTLLDSSSQYTLSNTFVAKLDTSGNFIWAKGIQGNLSNDCLLMNTNFYVNEAENLFFTGRFAGTLNLPDTTIVSNGDYDIYFIKMDLNGQILFARTFGNLGEDYGHSVIEDHAGNLYLMGKFAGPNLSLDSINLTNSANYSAFIAKFNSAGQCIRANKIDDLSANWFGGWGVDAANNLFISGYFNNSLTLDTITVSNSANGSDVFIAKYDPDGNIYWLKTLGGTGVDLNLAFCLDHAGNSLIEIDLGAGMTINNVYYDITNGSHYLVKLDSDGNNLWVSDEYNGRLRALDVDMADNVYMGFMAQGLLGALQIGDTTFVPYGTFNNQVVIAKLGNNFYVGPEEQVHLVTGKVFQESNSNCTNDSTEALLFARVIKATPGNYYTLTNAQGQYQMPLPLDTTISNYSIEAIPVNNLSFQSNVICPSSNSYSVSTSSIPDTISGIDFGYQINGCIQLDVQIASGNHNPCFTGHSAVSYTNMGLPANNVYIVLNYPPHVIPKSSNIPWQVLNDSTLLFNIGNLATGQSGTFHVYDSTACDVNLIGLGQCISATIYPSPNCASFGWNGAEIGVSGTCDNGVVYLDIFNEGTADMVDSVEYFVFIDSLVAYVAKVKLNAGDTLQLQAFANGHAVHIQINQVAFHPTETFVSLTIEACISGGIVIPTSYITAFPNQQSLNSKHSCFEINGSLDPNDKQVIPNGFTANHVVMPNTRLEYLIRFQNTGTDTAITVYILDTLSDFLDPTSLELGATSHQCIVSMQTNNQGKTALRWQFDEINLPDSNVNFLGSNGFVQFRISPKQNLPLGTQVFNDAAIYFDFNAPVFTNQTLTTFDLFQYSDSSTIGLVQEVPLVTQIPKLNQNNNPPILMLYPNPVLQNEITANFSIKASLKIYNAIGQNVFEQANIEGQQKLYLNLKSGIYFANIQTNQGVFTQKIIVK